MNLSSFKPRFHGLYLVLNPCDDWATYRLVLSLKLPFIPLFRVEGSDGLTTIAIQLPAWGEEAERLCSLARHAYLLYGLDRAFFLQEEQIIPEAFLPARNLNLNVFDPVLCCEHGLMHSPLSPGLEEDDLLKLPLVMNCQFEVLGQFSSFDKQSRSRLLPVREEDVRSDPELMRMFELLAAHALMDVYRESFGVQGEPLLYQRHTMGLIDIESHPRIQPFIDRHRGAVTDCLMVYATAIRKKLGYSFISLTASAIAVGVDRGFTHEDLVSMYRQFFTLPEMKAENVPISLLNRVATNDLVNFIEKTSPSEY